MPGRLPHRPDRDEYFMLQAALAGMRSNCATRRVGAVIARDRRQAATGHNGAPSGTPNCHEGRCGQDPEQEIVAELGACVLARMYGVERRADSRMAYIAGHAKAKPLAELGAACLRMANRTMKVVRLMLSDADRLA